MIKRVLSVVLCMAMLLPCSVAVNAEETAAPETMPTMQLQNGVTREELFAATTKTFSMYMSETHGHVKTEPTALTLWEQPILESGQNGIVCEMTVKNAGSMAATLKMAPVPLPYHDKDAMTYLNYVILKITDKETGEVLFHDSYAHINDPVPDPRATTAATAAATTVATTTATTAAPDAATPAPAEEAPVIEEAAPVSKGFTLIYPNMQPGETHTYQIEMRCLSSYDGEAPMNIEMPWSFEAQMKTGGVEEAQNQLPEWVQICLVGLAATIVLLIVVAILRAIAALVKKRKNPVDNED